ncbi:MAG TPA: nicotinamide-nucleotide amidohydrolase family protein, partial [Ignavibacteriaceae bacterium]
MPGVPFEMEEMMTSYVIPTLKEKIGVPEIISVRKTLLTTGIAESTLFERLGDINELIGDSKLAFLPSQFGVRLRITSGAESEEAALNKIIEIEQKIRSKAGRFIYGKDDELLEEVIGKILKERGLTLAVAESCTGGLISNMLTNISGSSTYFERGIVSYSNVAKVEILKVNEDMIVENGAVSIEVARQMAEGVKAISGTDLGLSTTGIMGPTGATADKPVGLVYIGICDEKVCTAKEFQFGDNRLLNKQRAAQAALELLRRHLLGISDD